LFNWLKWFDGKATKLPRATRWLEPFDYFTLVRYPHLQPTSAIEDARLATGTVLGRRVFLGSISEWESRIANHGDAQRVVDGLAPNQRQQVAALVIDSMADLENWQVNAKSIRLVSRLAKEGSRRQRVLLWKLKQAQIALRALGRYAEKLDPERNKLGPRPSWLGGLEEVAKWYESFQNLAWEKDLRPLRGDEFKSAAEKCLAILEQLPSSYAS